MDINKTTHVGTAISDPTLLTLGSGTPCAVFTMKFSETWKNKHGEQSRDNLVVFEALKDKAYWVKSNVKVGKRYAIDGMIRYDKFKGEDSTRIRIFRIEPAGSVEFKEGRSSGMKETLLKAINLVKNSDDPNIALAKLEVLLEEL